MMQQDNFNKKEKYIPALSFHFLTGYYDWIIKRVMPKGFREKLVQKVRPSANEKILDFGTGTAEVAILLKKEMPSTEITGIDIDKKVLHIAEVKIDAQKLSIQICAYDGTAFPFPDEYFDKVVSCLVFHHLSPQQKQQSFSEIKRVLKPGGKLYIADWGLERSKIKSRFIGLFTYLHVLKHIVEQAKGLLPQYMIDTGFKNVAETSYLRTVSGTLCYYEASKE